MGLFVPQGVVRGSCGVRGFRVDQVLSFWISLFSGFGFLQASGFLGLLGFLELLGGASTGVKLRGSSMSWETVVGLCAGLRVLR